MILAKVIFSHWARATRVVCEGKVRKEGYLAIIAKAGKDTMKDTGHMC